MPQPLVIVESPTKARTISQLLGSGYVVESSIGHVRDLPRTAAEIPKNYKSEKWARLGIDVDNGFKPLYIVAKEKKDQVRKLKSLMKEASELVLATDEDREGEAIAWHLLEVLNPRIPVKRMVFHEITAEAISEAIDNPRELDRRLVDAQEARRILDRLYGYEVSPVLWKKVKPRLSAGRVQSVATRIIVERERERIKFRSANYWDVTGTFTPETERSFTANLLELDGQRVATGRDFQSDGTLRRAEIVHLDEARAQAVVADMAGQPGTVVGREAKPYRRRPAAPFTTSTFQQEAGRKLRLSSAQAMRVAQGLYERGYITYMRTDSTTLSESAIKAAREQINQRFGSEYLPPEARVYKTKSKNAQEAHEAIRPSGEQFRTPEEVEGELSRQDKQVYELIWKRTIASQMTDATGETVTLRIRVPGKSGPEALFSAAGTVISHQGFLKAYVESADEAEADGEAAERRLPALTEGDSVQLTELSAAGHDTQPPARFTEASLVRRLEELEVGRPSTYASIMGTIQNRGYAWKKGTALVPSFLAFAVVTLLERHFPDLVDYEFTAQMESALDSIAAGSSEAVPWLSSFYFGEDDDPGLRQKVDERLGEIDARAVNSIPVGPDSNGELIVARVGQYGPYLQRGEETKSIPDDIPPDELTPTRAEEILAVPDVIELGDHPETGLPVALRDGKFGPYVQMGTFDDSDEKPQTSSLFQDMEMGEVTLEQAIELLRIPRSVGVDPSDGLEIIARNGPHGPYIEKGTKGEEGHDTRSFDDERLLLSMTVADALALFAEPRRRRGQTATGPLKRLGVDPATDREVLVKSGRFGEYVTDGETNASLQQGDSVERIDIMRASELLTIRRQKLELDPPKKKAAKKKKATKKKAAKKKATKKTAAKKKATKKTAKKAVAKKATSTPKGDDD